MSPVTQTGTRNLSKHEAPACQDYPLVQERWKYSDFRRDSLMLVQSVALGWSIPWTYDTPFWLFYGGTFMSGTGRAGPSLLAVPRGWAKVAR